MLYILKKNATNLFGSPLIWFGISLLFIVNHQSIMSCSIAIIYKY